MIIISLFSLCLLLIITFCFKFKLSIMNIKGKKEVNEDFIPVVYLNGSNLEYIEITDGLHINYPHWRSIVL